MPLSDIEIAQQAKMQRVTQVMHRLRDAGNSLVVVEHDPQIMLAADRLLDMGPGAGERGGEIVAFDTPEAIRANPASLTGQYLSGAKQVAPRAAAPSKVSNEPRAVMVPAKRVIRLTGVTEHNLLALHRAHAPAAGLGLAGRLTQQHRADLEV